MEIRRPSFDNPTLWPVLFVLGLATEVVVAVVAQFWATRYSMDSLSLGPVLFVLALACVYLGSQLLNGLYAIGTVPGMSLALLAAMLAWVGAGLLVVGLIFLVTLALYATIAVPVRLVQSRFRKRPRPRAPAAT